MYELRIYEAATERLYQQKVKMFNKGEIDIFFKLDFNPIFFAETLAGANMPNLMYMTSFPNMESRDAHWKAFGTDPDWDRMKVMEEYQNTDSRNDTRLLYPNDYSDLKKNREIKEFDPKSPIQFNSERWKPDRFIYR